MNQHNSLSASSPEATTASSFQTFSKASKEQILSKLKIVAKIEVERSQLYILSLKQINNSKLNQCLKALVGWLAKQQQQDVEQLSRRVSVLDCFEACSSHYAVVQVLPPSESSGTEGASATAPMSIGGCLFPRDRTTLDNLLTPREQEIICLIAFGLSNKQIASRLDISIWTVSAHLRRIFNKLNVDTRAAMVYQCASLIQTLTPQFVETTQG